MSETQKIFQHTKSIEKLKAKAQEGNLILIKDDTTITEDGKGGKYIITTFCLQTTIREPTQ